MEVRSVPRGPRTRRARRIAAALLVLVAIVLIAPPLLIRSSVVLERVKAAVLPRASAKIGRQVTLGNLDVHLFPVPHLIGEDLQIAGGPGEPPLLRVPAVRMSPELWPLLRSLGRDVRIRAVELDGAEIVLVKSPAGTWSAQGISFSGGAGTWSLSSVEIRGASIHVVDRVSGNELKLPRIDVHTGTVQYGQPLHFRLQAALGGERRNVDANLTLDPLPASMSALAGRGVPKLSGRIAIGGVPLDSLQELLPSGLADVFNAGVLAMDADARTAGDGTWVIAGPLQLQALQLRGKPASGSAQLSLSLRPDAPKRARLSLTELKVQGPGVDLGGTVSATAEPPKVDFELQGKELDVDALLAAVPQRPEATQAAGVDRPLVSGSMRSKLRKVAASGTLRLDRLVRGKLVATGLVATARLADGTLTFDDARASFFGGNLQARGTELDLRQQLPKWTLRAGLDGVKLQGLLGAVASAIPIAGNTTGQLQLTGAGNNWEQLRQAITGAGDLSVQDGSWAAVDLASALTPAFAPELQRLGVAPAVEKVAQATDLKNLRASFQVRQGWLELSHPLAFSSRFGNASLGGRIGTGGQLDLRGTADVAPDLVARISGGRLKPSAPVPVPLQLGGTLARPSVLPAAPAAVAEKAVQGELKKKAEQQIRARARRAFPRLFPWSGEAPRD